MRTVGFQNGRGYATTLILSPHFGLPKTAGVVIPTASWEVLCTQGWARGGVCFSASFWVQLGAARASWSPRASFFFPCEFLVNFATSLIVCCIHACVALHNITLHHITYLHTLDKTGLAQMHVTHTHTLSLPNMRSGPSVALWCRGWGAGDPAP